MDTTRETNAVGFAVLYLFLSGVIILSTVFFYERDYIYWSYVFAAILLSFTATWIIWYSYLHDSKAIAIGVAIVGITMLVLMTYFVLEAHKQSNVIVIRPI